MRGVRPPAKWVAPPPQLEVFPMTQSFRTQSAFMGFQTLKRVYPPPPLPPPTPWGSSEPSLHASNMGLLLDEALVPFHIQLLRGFKPSKRFIHPTQLEAPVSPAFFSVIPWLLLDQLHSLYVRRFRPSFFDVTIILHLRASWLAVIWFWKPYVVTKNNKDIICSRS